MEALTVTHSGVEIKRRRKVALVGFASSTKDLAPFTDDSFDIWGMNDLYRIIPRWDRLFEMHERERIRMDKMRGVVVADGGDHWKYLAALPGPGDPKFCPVYTQVKFDDMPASVAFPLEEMKARFGNEYFTSTPAYMMALAIADGYEEIHTYGIDLLTSEEYCVSPETKVLTSDLKWVEAQSLMEGDSLIGFDEMPNNTRPRRWKNTIVEGSAKITRPCVKIHLSDGSILTSSVEHRWLSTNGTSHRWMEASRLTSKDHYVKAKQNCSPSRLCKVVDVWEEEKDYGSGYLAAAFDGEGHLTQTKHKDGNSHNLILGFSQKENAMLSEVKKELDGKGFKYYSNNLDVQTLRISGGRAGTLRFLGSIRPKRLLSKFVPDRMGMFGTKETPTVTRVEYVGEQEVIALKTSTGTFVANGFASHNSYQRPCMEYWMGLAEGRGIKVVVPKQSALLKANYVYGYSYPPDPGQYAEIKAWIKDQSTKLESSKSDVEASVIRVEAVLRAANVMLTKLRTIKAADTEKWPELVSEMLTTLEADHERLVKQRDEVNHAHGAAQGSIQTANAFVSWIEHYERGGALQT